MNKLKKILKRFSMVLLGLIVLLLVGLFINSAVLNLRYSKLSTDSDMLSNEEIEQVKEVYEYLSTYGNDIFPGFDGKGIDLIIYNSEYEFLISNQVDEGEWKFVEKNEVLDKSIYQRGAINPQAFAVYTNGIWVGSMSTMNYYHKDIVSTIRSQTGPFGYFIPPQIFTLDDIHYQAVVIHEMLHAYQGQNNPLRMLKVETISNVCEKYYKDNLFQDLLKKEGEYLEKAIEAEEISDTINYITSFLKTRNERRSECKLTQREIDNEMEFEWLEGLARYAEYKSSMNSTSMTRKGMDKIEDKMANPGDDRYYILGMAQAMVLDKLDSEWKQDILRDGYSLEEALEQAINK